MVSDQLRFEDPKAYFEANPKEKIVLAVDLDEVCFDYLGGLRNFLVDHGFEIPEGKPEFWSLKEAGWFNSYEDFLKMHGRAVRLGLYRSLELLPGANEMLWELVRSGYESNIVTSRFVINQQHRTVVSQTVDALDFHSIPYSNLMFLKDKTRFVADAYLDDGPHNIVPLREQGSFVVKVNQLYNADLGQPEAENWWHARQILREHFGR